LATAKPPDVYPDIAVRALQAMVEQLLAEIPE
jgi:hypothetical protein